MVFSSSTATLVYWRQKKLLVKVAVLLILPAMLFSVFGSMLTLYFNARILVLFFALVLLLISLQMLVPSLCVVPTIAWGPSFAIQFQGDDQNIQPVRIPFVHLVVWGAMGGLVSGTTGISGGVLFVPALIVIGVPVHFAVATSLLAIIPASISGAATHAVLGNVSLPFLLLYGVGAGIGAFAGASIAPRIHADQIRKFFGILLVFIVFLMIQQKVLVI
jgi:hypothetical protein